AKSSTCMATSECAGGGGGEGISSGAMARGTGRPVAPVGSGAAASAPGASGSTTMSRTPLFTRSLSLPNGAPEGKRRSIRPGVPWIRTSRCGAASCSNPGPPCQMVYDPVAMAEITRVDLEPVLAVHRGTEARRAAVDAAAEAPHFLSVVARYIQFNSAFGPGLANLAGEIAARQGLFRDRAEPVRILSDRAAEVA